LPKVSFVPANDVSGEQVQPDHSGALAPGGLITVFSLLPDAQNAPDPEKKVFMIRDQRKMRHKLQLRLYAEEISHVATACP